MRVQLILLTLQILADGTMENDHKCMQYVEGPSMPLQSLVWGRSELSVPDVEEFVCHH